MRHTLQSYTDGQTERGRRGGRGTAAEVKSYRQMQTGKKSQMGRQSADQAYGRSYGRRRSVGSGQLILRQSPDCEDQDVSHRVGDLVGLKDQDALRQEEETDWKKEVQKTGGRGGRGGKIQETWDIRQEMDRK